MSLPTCIVNSPSVASKAVQPTKTRNELKLTRVAKRMPSVDWLEDLNTGWDGMGRDGAERGGTGRNGEEQVGMGCNGMGWDGFT